MTTTKSETEIWLSSYPKSNLNSSCLPINGDVPLLFPHFQTSKCYDK